VLKSAPDNRRAVELEVEALVGKRDPAGALTAIETFARRTGTDAPELFRLLARTELRALARDTVTLGIAAEARRVLAARDPAVLKALDQPAAGSGREHAMSAEREPGKAGAPAAAGKRDSTRAPGKRAAEPEAPTRSRAKTTELEDAAAKAPMPRRAVALRELAAAPTPRTAALVREALRSEDKDVQAAALDAVVTLRLKEAIPEVRALLGERMYLLGLRAAAVLSSLGDASAEARLRESLDSSFFPARLVAARGLKAAGDASWVGPVTAVLEGGRPHEQVAAAGLLLDSPRRAEAARFLANHVADPDPTVRDEVVRMLAEDPGADAGMFRALLGDASPWVRLRAADVVLR
jgi:hypothetical protein